MPGMSNRGITVLIAVALSLSANGCSKESKDQIFTSAPDPLATVTSISPSTGALGTSVPVTITGTNFEIGGLGISYTPVANGGLSFQNLEAKTRTTATTTVQISRETRPGTYTFTFRTLNGFTVQGAVSFTVTESR